MTKEQQEKRRRESYETLSSIHKTLDETQKPFIRKIKNFQVFVTILLLGLVLITSLSFTFTMSVEREQRDQALARQILFEDHVTNILDSIEGSQLRGARERDELHKKLEEIRMILREHTEDERF